MSPSSDSTGSASAAARASSVSSAMVTTICGRTAPVVRGRTGTVRMAGSVKDGLPGIVSATSAPRRCRAARGSSGDYTITTLATRIHSHSPTEFENVGSGIVGGDNAGYDGAIPAQLFLVVKPPSTTRTAPVQYDMAGSASDSVAWATSSGLP